MEYAKRILRKILYYLRTLTRDIMPSLQWKHINRDFKEVNADGKEHGKWKVTDKGDYYAVVFASSNKFKGKFYKLPDGKHAVYLSSGNPLFFEIVQKKGGMFSSGGTFLKYLKGASESDIEGSAEGVAAIQAAKEAKASEGFKPRPIGVLRAVEKVDYYKRIYGV